MCKSKLIIDPTVLTGIFKHLDIILYPFPNLCICITLSQTSVECSFVFIFLQSHSLTNDPSTVGFLSRKCDSNFIGSQVEANGKVNVSLLWQFLSSV